MSLTSLLRIALTRSIKPFIFTNQPEEHLAYQDTSRLGLYVHIPFCRTLCSFCPYCKVVYNKELAAAYKEALLQEIALVGRETQGQKEVTSLYFGGGTPALMLDDLADLIGEIRKHFVIRDGIGVELHPDDVSESTLRTLKEAGVTMISIGVQSFNRDSLTALGRKCPDYGKIFDAIRQVPFDTVDMDLIFAIPGQTAQSLKDDIRIAFENGATQISTYPFIDFTFTNNKYRPMAERDKKALLSEITAYCREEGYERTSVWTFAKPGTVKYSSVTRENFLGFGVSATTLLRDQFKINTFKIEEYIERIEKGRLPTSLTLRFSLRQRAVYYLFWSAYGMRIHDADYQAFFGRSLAGMYGFELSLAGFLGLVSKNRDGYELTERGAYYYHFLEQAYTTAYIDKMWNISRKVAFPEQIVLK